MNVSKHVPREKKVSHKILQNIFACLFAFMSTSAGVILPNMDRLTYILASVWPYLIVT